MEYNIRAFFATIQISFKQIFDGNMFQVMLNYLLQFVELIFLVNVWNYSIKSDASFNNIAGYIILSYILTPQFNIITPATSALWEGSIINRYTRPLPVITSFIAEMIGKTWLPYFLFFSIPTIILANVFYVSLAPTSIIYLFYFLISLILSISMGITFDIIFASLAIYLKDARWAAFQIRMALFSLFSGALIPFQIMPYPLSKILIMLPFGSIANGPLSIYFGLEEPIYVLLKQLFWSFIFCWFALVIYKHSQERMVSFGG